jgi:hypothetical protein
MAFMSGVNGPMTSVNTAMNSLSHAMVMNRNVPLVGAPGMGPAGMTLPEGSTTALGKGLKASLPAIQKWKADDCGIRDADLFLRDVLLNARAGGQAEWLATAQLVDDVNIRLAFEEKMSSIVSEAGRMPAWAEVCAWFKFIVGAHLISQKDKLLEQLTQGGLVQGKSESAAQYGVRARVWRMRLYAHVSE